MLHGVSASHPKKARGDIPIPLRYAGDTTWAAPLGRVRLIDFGTRSHPHPKSVRLFGIMLWLEEARLLALPRFALLRLSLLRLRTRLQLVRSAGAGRAEEQLAAVREGQVAAVGAVRAVL